MARKISIEILGDSASLQRAFRNSSRGAKNFEHDVSRASRGAISAAVSFHSLGRSLAFASAQFLGGAGIVYGFKQIVGEASRVQEETEKTSVVFRKNAAQVQSWSKTLAQSFGISDAAAFERLVELAADMASFNNAKPAEVLAALSSGLAGQVRPLRQYGVFLSQARIQQEAYTSGIARQGAKLTQAQKVQASYNIILKDTRNAQGDVARNTGSLSVAMSKLTAGIQDTEAGLGQALLPSITTYVNKAALWLNQTKNQERIQHDFNETLQTSIGVARNLAAAAKTTSHALGGFKGTVEFIIGLKLASMLWKSKLAMDALGLSTLRTGTAMTTLMVRARAIAALGTVTLAFRFPGLAAGLAGLAGIPALVAAAAAAGPLASSGDAPNVSGFATEGQKGRITQAVAGFATSGKIPREVLMQIAGLYGLKGDQVAGNVFKDNPEFVKALYKWAQDHGLTGTSAGGSASEAAAKARRGRGATTPTSTTTSAVGIGAGGLDRGSKLDLAVSNANLAVSRGEKGAKQQLVAALKEKIDFDAKYAKIQRGLIGSDAKNAKQHAKSLQALLADEQSAYDQISSLEKDGTKAADKAHKKKLSELKKQAAAAKAAAAAEKQAMQLDTAKAAIGDIGQGPIATGDTAQFLQQYGGHLGAGAYTQDLGAQNKQFAAFTANLARLRKRGAPAALTATLFGQGQAGMAEASALSHADPKTLRSFLREYSVRQRLLMQATKAEIRTPHATVTIDRATVTVGRTDAHDRRGDVFGSGSGRKKKGR